MAQDRRQAIERLFHQYGEGVGSYLLARVGDPELAEELTARVFLTVVRSFEQLRGHPAGWLWAIARSQLARYYRDEDRHLPPDPNLPAPDALPPETVIRRETHGRLQAALHRLSEEQQEIVYLKFFLEMRNRDIAAALGLTPSNVGVMVHRAVKELRSLMESREDQTREVHNERPAR